MELCETLGGYFAFESSSYLLNWRGVNNEIFESLVLEFLSLAQQVCLITAGQLE